MEASFTDIFCSWEALHKKGIDQMVSYRGAIAAGWSFRVANQNQNWDT